MGGIWKERMFMRAATTKSVGEMVAGILEACGLRCSKCRRWCDSTITVTVSLDPAWGVTELLLMDPIYHKVKVRTCRCGHTMFSRTVTGESV